MNMTSMANNLSALSGRQVVDQTGLNGSYDFDLRYAPDDLAAPDPSWREGGRSTGAVSCWLAASSRLTALSTAGVFWKGGTRRRRRSITRRAPVSWSSPPIDASKLPNIYPAVIPL